MTSSWFAAYLYYARPWDPLIIEAVAPFIDQVLADQLADHYFYIRYWERGPHIRLRFKGDPEKMEHELKPRLEAWFHTWFKQNPSTRPEWMTGREGYFPNNSIQYLPYEPETVRYGGEHGLPIAERQFELSTRTVLTIMRESEDWDYDAALGSAIQLHIIFLHSLGLSLDALKRFSDMVCHAWTGRAYDHDENTTQEEHRERIAEIHAAFAETFEQQKPMLVNFCGSLWEGLEQQVEFEQHHFQQWRTDMTEYGQELIRTWKAGNLALYPSTLLDACRGGNENDLVDLWLILESFIHMTNNRLGILNQDEAFLGYLIKNSLDALSTGQTNEEQA